MAAKIIFVFSILFSISAFAGSGHIGDDYIWPGNLDAMNCWESSLDYDSLSLEFYEYIKELHSTSIKTGEISVYPELPDGAVPKSEFKDLKKGHAQSVGWALDSTLEISVTVKESFEGARSWEYALYEYRLQFSNPALTGLKNGDPAMVEEFRYSDVEYGLGLFDDLKAKGFDFYANSCADSRPVRLVRVYWPITSRPGYLSELPVPQF